MMSTEDLYQRDQDLLALNAQLRFAPVSVESAKGSTFIEPGGRTLIDLSAGGSAAGLGYAHPHIIEAVVKAINVMPGVSSLMSTHPYAIRLAEKLLEVTPTVGDDRRVYLGLSGSDANSMVIRGIRAYTSKPKIIAFEHSYHGGVGLAQGISGVWEDSGIYMDPHLVLVPYGDIEAVRRHLKGGDVAAVFVEPILSDGGLVIPDPSFLRELREATTGHDSLLVVDEVKVGLARTGRMFAFEHDDIVPDIVTIGKSLGGGLPISAAVGPTCIFNAQPAISILTLAGNSVTAASALATLEIIESERIAERSERLGRQFAKHLHALAEQHELIVDVRSRGLVGGIELKTTNGEPATLETAKFMYRAWQLGVVMICVGPSSNVIELTPPLIISEAELDLAFNRLNESLRDVVAGKVSDQEVDAFSGW